MRDLSLVLGIHNIDNYYIHSLVTLNSLLSRTSGMIQTHIFHDDTLTREISGFFKNIADNYKSEIVFHNLSVQLKSLHFEERWKHFSPGCLLRLFIPSVFKDEQVLYLDSDTVVTGDIFKIFKSVRHHPEKSLWAVNDAFASTSLFAEHLKNIKIPPDFYFNSGVLFFDVKNFNLNIPDLIPRARELLVSKLIKFPDQDILNILAYERNIVAPLPQTANFQIGLGKGHYEIDKLQNRVVHYSHTKPWNKLYPAGRLYWQEQEKIIPFLK